jgi:Zn-dependent protease/CBS domain-containing protein
MLKSFRIVRIFGIDINIDLSWIIVFLLVYLNVSIGVFGPLKATLGPILVAILGIVTSLLFFVSVLIHELGHSLVAKKYGLPVKEITLFIFGGISNMEKEPDSPGSEFLIAIVGPLLSLVLGTIFLYFSGAVLQVDILDAEALLKKLPPFSLMLLWLGSVNIFVGFFNLIPGFPLDGGRILRSILWKINGSLHQATKWACMMGKIIAWIFILVGLLNVLNAFFPSLLKIGVMGGIWFIAIGWFLHTAASQYYQQMILREFLEKIPVSKLMRVNIPSVSPDLSIQKLVDDYIMGTDMRSFPVMENGRLAGIIQTKDLKKIPRQTWKNTPIKKIILKNDAIEKISPENNVYNALLLLMNRDHEQIPVIKNGDFKGMLSRRDILVWLKIQGKTDDS